jgi:hypothetical protein
MAKKGGQHSAPRKRGPGRPPTTGIGVAVLLRCHEHFLTAVDRWRAQQDGQVSRPDAIRRLAEMELARAQPVRKSIALRSKASEMAAQVIDQLIDEAATDDERARRKRQLLKGPKEFRDIGGDLSKAKS